MPHHAKASRKIFDRRFAEPDTIASKGSADLADGPHPVSYVAFPTRDRDCDTSRRSR
jgi:hypothetical protein